MMKKLLLLSSAVFAFTASVNAQSNFAVQTAPALEKHPAIDLATTPQAKSTSAASITITDTLWYFYNKHFYRNPASTGFYTLKNAPTYTSTTAITQGGAVFKNSGSILVSGAEGVAVRQASSPSPTVNIGLFLYNVTGGIPTGAPIASVVAGISTSTAGSFFGGNFTVPQIVTGDYAIMMQNVSTNPADTVRLFINNAFAPTATVGTTAQRYGEGFGVMRVGTTSFSLTTGSFVAGGDLEFLVAPRVTYSVNAGANAPTTASLCVANAYSFTNTSSAWLGHRQYNLNQFAVEWLPFANTASTSIMADPVYVWNFGDLSPSTTTNGTVTTVSKTYNTAGTFNGTLTANQQRMSDYSNNKSTSTANFSKTVILCGPVGINTVSGFESFNLYPNPTVSGKANLTGLVGANTITVYNMIGQVVSSQITSNEVASLDLSAQPVGTYFVKITNSDNATKTVKIINQ